MSKFRSCGQTCISANRIYVHSSVYAEFASRMAEKVSAFKVGDGLLTDVCVSSLVTCLHGLISSVIAVLMGP